MMRPSDFIPREVDLVQAMIPTDNYQTERERKLISVFVVFDVPLWGFELH